MLAGPKFSRLYRTEPQDDAQQPPFWNAAASGEWSGTPEALLERLLMWEAKTGRIRDPQRPKGPRLIDLDLLLVGSEARQSSRLWLPHPGLSQRRFALEPLVELVPDARDPVSGLLWREVLNRLPPQGVDPTDRTW